MKLLQARHGFLRSFTLCWVALKAMRVRVLYHDCATKLRTRFVLIENFTIRRYSITKVLWMLNIAVASGRFLYGARVAFVSFQTSRFYVWQYWVCQLACVCLASWSSPSYHPVFSLLTQLHVVPPRHSVSREGGVATEAFFERLKPLWYLFDWSLGAWTPGKCNRSPDAWLGFSWLFTIKLRLFLSCLCMPLSSQRENSFALWLWL